MSGQEFFPVPPNRVPGSFEEIPAPDKADVLVESLQEVVDIFNRIYGNDVRFRGNSAIDGAKLVVDMIEAAIVKYRGRTAR